MYILLRIKTRTYKIQNESYNQGGINSCRVDMAYLCIMIKSNNHYNYFIVLQHTPFDDYLHNNRLIKNLVWQKFIEK